MISLPFQNNTNFEIGPYDRTQNVLNVQPVVPLAGGRIITRTILPILCSLTSRWNPGRAADWATFSSRLSTRLRQRA